jgi:hypothetical protein
MLKCLLALGVAVGLWLSSGPADAQRQIDLRCRDGREGCFDRCGVIVLPVPGGGVEVAENPVCIAQCAMCPVNPNGPPQCGARFDCIGGCRAEFDPQTRTPRVDPACLAQCPAC